MDRPKHAAARRVEAARGHVDVLSLDLELTATAHRRPVDRGIEQGRTGSMATGGWRHANVPKQRHVAPPLVQIQRWRVAGDGRPADALPAAERREESPVRQIEL